MDNPNDPLVIVFIPPLLTLLAQVEKAKGSPLTEVEVLDVRNNAIGMTMRRSMAIELAQRRGYDDIDPENVWAEWQTVRAQLTS